MKSKDEEEIPAERGSVKKSCRRLQFDGLLAGE